MTTEPTISEPVVIFPAVTIQADFVDRVERHAMKLYDAAVGLADLLREARALTLEYRQVLEQVEGAEQVDAVSVESGYGAVRAMWAMVAHDIGWALGDQDEPRSGHLRGTAA